MRGDRLPWALLGLIGPTETACVVCASCDLWLLLGAAQRVSPSIHVLSSPWQSGRRPSAPGSRQVGDLVGTYGTRLAP